LFVVAAACSSTACGRTDVDEGQSGHAAADSATTDSATTEDARTAEDAFAPIDGPSMVDVATDVDFGACMILASNYFQSCIVDFDCVEVSSGDYCSPLCPCGGPQST
jgi:hypothetical protein